MNAFDSKQSGPVKNSNPACQKEFPVRRDQEHRAARRSFLQFLGMAAATFLGVLGVKAARIFESDDLGNAPVAAALEDEIPVGGYKLLRFPARHDPCILIHRRSGEYLAYSQSCTHLLCPVHFRADRDQFVCPCHEGYFSADDGRPLAGPPRRPLPSYPVVVKEGQIWIHPTAPSDEAAVKPSTP